MSKRARFGSVVLSKALISLTLDFLGFQDVYKYARRVCSMWASGIYFKYVEWDTDTCSFHNMAKLVNPASVRAVKLSGTRGPPPFVLNFFTNARILYLADADQLELEHTFYTHVFIERGLPRTYPATLTHLFVDMDAFEFEKLSLPNLTVLQGAMFPFHAVKHNQYKLDFLSVYKYDPSVQECIEMNSFPKTFHLQIQARRTDLHNYFSSLSPADNLYFSLRDLRIPTSLSDSQWTALSALPGLETVSLLANYGLPAANLPSREVIKTYRWPALSHVEVSSKTELHYLPLFTGAVNLRCLTFGEFEEFHNDDDELGVVTCLPQVERVELDESHFTIHKLLRNFVNLQEVKGTVEGPADMLNTMKLPLTVKIVNLLTFSTILVDTIAGFMFRHRFRDVTLRTEGYAMERPHKIRSLANVPGSLRLGVAAMCNMTHECRKELERVVVLFVHEGNPDEEAEHAFQACIQTHSQMINAL